MSEARVFADEFQTTFAREGELMRFLRERKEAATWLRKPTKDLRLVSMESEKAQKEVNGLCDEEVLEDTKNHTQLLLRMKEGYYPVRQCAIQTILKRAGISGSGLNRLDRKTYARIVNMCLQTAKGESLIRIADDKVSAVHGGDYCDYKILDTETLFQETIRYLEQHFKGFQYLPDSGSYDHNVVTAMWELSGNTELVENYQEALEEHGIESEIYAPALRLSTSDVANKSVTLYPMLLCDGNNQTINLGHPIRLEHSGEADIEKFREKLKGLYSRYQDAIMDIEHLLYVPIHHPVNCLISVMKELHIGKKLGSQALELYVAQNGEGQTTAHALYYALNEVCFFAACEGRQGSKLLKMEEDITKALHMDWTDYDLFGTVSW